MKKFENYDLAVEMNDYKVTLISDDNYNVVKIIAEENINESKKHNYKKGEEIKFSKSYMKFISENLYEENTPFSAED